MAAADTQADFLLLDILINFSSAQGLGMPQNITAQ